MSKIIDIIFGIAIMLILIFTFSNGVVYFIKNKHKDEKVYLTVLITLLIVNVIFIIEHYKSLKIYKDEK